MKKLLLTLPVFLLIINFQTNAQESIGYSDPDDFQYLIDYRLPDWGYSNFYISSAGSNFSSFDRSVRSQEGQPSDPFYELRNMDVSNRNYGIGVAPRFEFYKENEQRRIVFDSNISLNTNGRKTVSTDETTGNNFNFTSEDFSKNSGKTFGNQIFFNISEYSEVESDLFFTAGLFSRIQYNREDSERKDDPGIERNVTLKRRTIYLNPSFGIGFGRLRNVTPMIRAIRVNERYKELGNSAFNSNEIIQTADLFTKVQGYQSTKDRFLKSFWGDINTGVNGKLTNLDSFDLFYLNDVFDENLGQRLEGYSLSITGDYSYNNNLSKEEKSTSVSTDTERDFSITRVAAVNLNAEWYKNLNLYHQIHLDFSNSTSFPLEKDIQEEWANTTSLNFGWLWNFADRFQFNSALENYLFTRELKDMPEDKFISFVSEISGHFSYFIENKMSLSAGLTLQYRKLDREFDTINLDDDLFVFSINAGVRYYFNRNLY
ncbi:MAG: hypothetical protein JJ892_12845 [Balneola sp.]|nr:hypothetical protein [Balneola sp.]MBO6651704.1 hypothetical protein [Balneola sp.]MBO6712858.1 hypothetical protein [Balneola sp.]MBO6801157.1 hypothetical protein [Balneola sp.]MBO6871349.1 hypothetical protein [Balneola sp.]